MDEKILEILRARRESFVTAEEIGARAEMSKTTVFRHIHKLREEGYDIQSQPHGGYRLVNIPDRLSAQELGWRLHTKTIAKKILAYDVVDSTNAVAFALAQRGASEHTAVFAEGQKKGRGRLGRQWVSPKSKGIYCSLILRPKISPDQAAIVTLMAAVSCAQAIRKMCGLNALIRWPNDILVNDKKVCGILTQMYVRDNSLEFIILGIGINVNTGTSKLPREASSLREECRDKSPICRIQLSQELLRHLDKEYAYLVHKGPEHIIECWSDFSALSGKRVKVYLANKSVEGQALGIDKKGALIVRQDNGFRQHFLAADAIKVR
ncbi:MAG: biotin--[acetyl-CoA-carboxylase] ligase [Candidatus Omnitrophica bacterium]|nr:biotin--[acetyl-CoA-carboxylase] ligase [Candidatus Omnitrophota bacterium]